MCRWKSSRMEAERFDEPRSSLFALAAAEYCPLLPQARLNSLVVVVVVVAIELEPMACCYITSFSVTLPFAQDSLVRASMDHRMDNSFLESCRIEGVHFRDLIDVCLAWGGILEFGSHALRDACDSLLFQISICTHHPFVPSPVRISTLKSCMGWLYYQSPSSTKQLQLTGESGQLIKYIRWELPLPSACPWNDQRISLSLFPPRHSFRSSTQ